MKRRGLIIFISILFLGVGFASVSTSLYINSNVSIDENSEDFSVKFIDFFVDDNNLFSSSVAEDGDSLVYNIKNLISVGDKANLTFNIKNNSSLYDAKVSIKCSSSLDDDSYKITYDDLSVIEAKRNIIGHAEIELLDNLNIDDGLFSCKLVTSPVERTTAGTSIYSGWIPKYFEFGVPNNSSKTNYNDLSTSVFAGIDDSLNKGVCINDNGLFCLKSNDLNSSIRNLKEYFNSDKCFSSEDGFFYCYSDMFTCTSYFDGKVSCAYNNYNKLCEVSSDGVFSCK